MPFISETKNCTFVAAPPPPPSTISLLFSYFRPYLRSKSHFRLRPTLFRPFPAKIQSFHTVSSQDTKPAAEYGRFGLVRGGRQPPSAEAAPRRPNFPFFRTLMLTNGQSTLDMFSLQTGSNDLMRQAQIFLYANGNDHPPTAIDLDKSLLKELLFNQSPAKDIALASVSMRPIPFAPVLEKLSLSDLKYGSVRRYYIETPEDNAIPISLQESMINSSPPKEVFRLKGADHSPFFSKPQALHKLLVEISKIPST